MNKFYQEITEWADTTVNHIYLLTESKDKMVGYVKASTNQLQIFKAPLPFSTTRRKFKEVENQWSYVEKPVEEVGQSWKVSGSKGNTYTVRLIDGEYSCTCSGFKFRGQCKHIEGVK